MKEWCPECRSEIVSVTRGIPSMGICKNGHKTDRRDCLRREPAQQGERYEPRHVPNGNMPTDCCEFGVVDLDIGQEICRAWTSSGARRIANALNGVEGRKLNIIGSCLRSAESDKERDALEQFGVDPEDFDEGKE